MSKKDARIYHSDIQEFIKSIPGRIVRVFVREASDTHFSRVYVMAAAAERAAEPACCLYEAFQNFTADAEGRRLSSDIAKSELSAVRSLLEKNGFQVLDRGGEP
jgi:hypothetical protein